MHFLTRRFLKFATVAIGPMLVATMAAAKPPGAVPPSGMNDSNDGTIAKGDLGARMLPPTLAAVSYGPHEENTLNFWKVVSTNPTPVIIAIHGGGWVGGGKKTAWPANSYLDRGISVVSVDYRFSTTAPLPAPVHDAARAVQFVRSKAAEWNIDNNRIALLGGSAGGCTALWLALHDDLADPASADPVARESTKPACVVALNAQSSLEPAVIREWIGDLVLQHTMIFKAVGATSSQDLLDHPDTYRALQEEFSPIRHIDKDDPPIFLQNNHTGAVPAANVGNAIHHPQFSLRLKAAADAAGAECHVVTKDVTTSVYRSSYDFLKAKLNLVGAPETVQ